MKKFYLCTGNIPKGPFRADELIQRGISQTDLIWCEGFMKCKLAADIAELKKIFTPVPENKPAVAKHRLKPVAVKRAYNINEDLEAIYPEKNIDSKYLTLLIWSVFVVIALIVYYCIIEFLY